MSTLRVILYDKTSGEIQTGGGELIDTWQRQGDNWIWADLAGAPDEEERRLLIDRFRISRLAVQDAQRDRHPPKLELFDEFIFMMLRDLITAYEDSEPEIGDLAMFAGKDFLITRHHGSLPSVDAVYEATLGKPSRLAAGPGHLAYTISRRIVDTYTPEILELEEHLGDLEDQVFEKPDDDVIESLSRYNRALKRMRRHLVYQYNVMAQLARPSDSLPLELNPHEFQDLFENLERLASLCQLNQELAVDLLNTHLSLLSHRLNQVMRVLTIATVIFLPLGLLAGIYGMNFEFMPELSWHYGYFAVLGTMATVVTALVMIFRRRRWL